MVIEQKEEPAWRYAFAAFRHSHLLMRPVSFLMLIILCLYWLTSFILSIPSTVLGFVLGPLVRRAYWLVEFLYPSAIARYAHIFLIGFAERSRKRHQNSPSDKKVSGKNGGGDSAKNDDKNRGFHSRTIEQRIEIIPSRVFIHPLTQLLDNLGYLVVCCPDPSYNKRKKDPIVAFVVDCGDAESAMSQIQLISKFHYQNNKIIVQAILSTHKHHDHTAGNRRLIELTEDDKIAHSNPVNKDVNANKNSSHTTKTTKSTTAQAPGSNSTIKHVFGGAVENVPYCNVFLADGDKLQLPSAGENRMSELIEVETIVVPAHTRGSVVYVLRTKIDQCTVTTSAPTSFLFTGDTLFSGGGGVPFEAGTNPMQDKGIYNNPKQHGKLNTGSGNHAVERCFAEILSRGLRLPQNCDAFTTESAADNFILFPGHEYTAELLARQFHKESMELSKWQNLPPKAFFDTVSTLYVSLHRRSLPYGSGKLLVVPSTMERELNINPHVRSLTKRAEAVIAAVRLWADYFALKQERDERIPLTLSTAQPKYQRTENTLETDDSSEECLLKQATTLRTARKTSSSHRSWNLGATDIASSVFTTLYTEDLEAIIDQLDTGMIDTRFAADQLREIKSRLEKPPIRRRPIPGTLPSERNMYKGLVGLAILGSKPSALTLADSRALKLPPPVVSNSDNVMISKRRLITVLSHLGLLSETSKAHNNHGNQIIDEINQLWKEAHQYREERQNVHSETNKGSKTRLNENEKTTSQNKQPKYDAVDLESPSSLEKQRVSKDKDLIELGILKWMLYGLVTDHQKFWLGSLAFCMPCTKSSNQSSDKGDVMIHPSELLEMRRQHGELVRHDILQCALCRGSAGFFDPDEENDTVGSNGGIEANRESENLLSFQGSLVSSNSYSSHHQEQEHPGYEVTTEVEANGFEMTHDLQLRASSEDGNEANNILRENNPSCLLQEGYY